MDFISRVTLSLVIIGAINWGLIGLFQFDLVASLFGGQAAFIPRVIYTLVGLSGLFCIGLLFEPLINDDKNAVRPGDVTYNTELGEESTFQEDNKNED